MTAKIVYYKSLVCPRCIPTNKMLKAFRRRYPEVEIEEVEVLTNLKRARADGILQVPTIIVGPHRIYQALPLEEFARLALASDEASGDGPSQTS